MPQGLCRIFKACGLGFGLDLEAYAFLYDKYFNILLLMIFLF